MQVITDLHDKALYAPLHEAMDTRIEPWHMPHFAPRPMLQEQAPAPAEAPTEVGTEEPARKPLTDAERVQMVAIYTLSAVAAVSAVVAILNAAGFL